MIPFLRLIRFPNLLLMAFTQYMVRWCLIYPIFKIKGLELQMSELSFFFLALSTVLIGAAGYIINDYCDVNIDKINKPEKQIIDKYITRKSAMTVYWTINIIAVSIGIVLSYQIGMWSFSLIYFIMAGGLWYYSSTFKREFLIGNILIALFTALVPLISGLIELLLSYKEYVVIFPSLSFKNIWILLFGLCTFAFIITLLREIIKDIEDYEGDKKEGCQTLPVVVGIKGSKIITISISIITMIALAHLQTQQIQAKNIASFIYFIFALQLPFAFLIFKIFSAKDKNDFKFASTLCKGIMFMGISYLFLFSYSLLALSV